MQQGGTPTDLGRGNIKLPVLTTSTIEAAIIRIRDVRKAESGIRFVLFEMHRVL
jgi:hypothetical protein